MAVKTHELNIVARFTNTALDSAVSGATGNLDEFVINGVEKDITTSSGRVLSSGEVTTLVAALKTALVAALT